MDCLYEYDEPRKAPVPLSAKSLSKMPFVPEVSMVFQNNPNKSIDDLKYQPLSYNAWKEKNQNALLNDKENKILNQECQNKDFLVGAKKKVYFKDNSNLQKNDDIYIYKRPTDSLQDKFSGTCQQAKSNFHKPQSFEQIYMANVPNRHLDLSIIDDKTEPQKMNCNKKLSNNYTQINNSENVSAKQCQYTLDDYFSRQDTAKNYSSNGKVTGNNICENKNNDKVINLFDYKNPSTENVGRFNSNKKEKISQITPQICTNLNISNEKTHEIRDFQESYQSYDLRRYNNAQLDLRNENEGKSTTTLAIKDDQPTVKDLLKIIQQQNEQLLLLQKQVATLIENQEKNKTADMFTKCPISKSKYTYLSNPVDNFYKNSAPSQFSIDVMTSFEVSIRPQQNKNRYFDSLGCQTKIQEITETDSKIIEEQDKTENIEKDSLSIALNEPLEVLEDNQSPDNSIHIDMQDYSSEDESISESGWTFYNNVMKQVNNILTKSKKTVDGDDSSFKNNTMRKVKEATINHLRSIGVNVPTIEEETEIESNCDTNEISFTVKQLMMKYLPDEHLSKITYKQTQRIPVKTNVHKDAKIIKRPEFSFASVEYMKKYNLLSTEQHIKKYSPVPTQQQNLGIQNKILDITALKQQPKLM